MVDFYEVSIHDIEERLLENSQRKVILFLAVVDPYNKISAFMALRNKRCIIPPDHISNDPSSDLLSYWCEGKTFGVVDLRIKYQIAEEVVADVLKLSKYLPKVVIVYLISQNISRIKELLSP
jgi:hypothetical protein